MFDDYLTINQLAKLLGVKFYQIRYLHQAGYVQEPEKVGNVRLYSPNDIEKIVRFLEIHRDWDKETDSVNRKKNLGESYMGSLDDHIIYVKEKNEFNEEGYKS